MWCESDNHNDMCHICRKELLDSNFGSYEAVIYKISIFNEIAQNFTCSQNSYFLNYNWDFLDHPLLSYKFHGGEECTFPFLLVVSRLYLHCSCSYNKLTKKMPWRKCK